MRDRSLTTVVSCLGGVLALAILSAFAPAGDSVTVFLAGDSTMSEKVPEKRPETGWGEMLQQHFDEARVRVENHARGGRSTRTFLEEGRWQAIVERVRPGDYVFIQFGHNDASVERPERYTPPDDYRANLVRFVSEVRDRGATPVLMTPIMRRRFDETGAFRDVHGPYPGVMREVAAAHGVTLIDMHRSSERAIVERGVEGSKVLFLHLKPGDAANYPDGLEDNTHFSPLGAEVMARLAVEGVREQKLGIADSLKGFGPSAVRK